jgi:tetratricopeptide (TPR) repeat protein
MAKTKPSWRVNWPLIGGLLGGIVVLAIVGFFVHGWQMSRHEEYIRAQVAQAEAAGKPGEAIAALERYLMLNPEHQESLARLGKLLDSVADSPAGWSRALIVNEKVLSKDNANHDLRRRVAALARLLGDIPLASTRLQELRVALPGDADARTQLGDLFLQVGEPDNAILQYQDSIKAQPKQTNAYVRLALLYQTQKQETLADQTIEKMVAAQPERWEVYLERGYYRQLKSGLIAEAADDFKKAREMAPKEAPPLQAAAQLELARGHFEEAGKLLNEGRDKHPELLVWYRDGGQLALLQDKPDEALTWVEGGLKLAPQDADLWHLRIEASRLKKDFKAARADIAELEKKEAAKTAYIPHGLVSYLLARVDMAEGKSQRAIEEFRKVLGDQRTSSALRARCALSLAEIYATLGQPDRQLIELRQAVKLDPDLRPATLHLGRLLLAQGKTEEALRLLQALTLRPEPPVEASLELARAWLLMNLGLPEDRRNWEAPLRALKVAEQSPAYQIEVALLRADVLLAQGKPTDAERTLAEATQASPKDARLWAARIALARRQGDDNRAKKLADEAVKKADDPTLVWLGTLQNGDRVSLAEKRAIVAALEAKIPTLPRAEQIALLQALGRTGDVEHYARQLAELQPPDGTTLIPALELALLGRDSGLVAKIVKELRAWEGEGSLAAKFGEAAWLVRMARRLRPELLTQARPVLEQIAEARPSWSAPVAWLARLEDQADHRPEATKLYRQAFDLGDRNPGLWLRLLELLVAADDIDPSAATKANIDAADAVFRQVERSLLPSGEMARLGAEIARRKTEPERARHLALSARPVGKDDPTYLLWLGAFLDKLGEPREALVPVRKAVELDPVNPDGWVLWVSLLVKTGAKQQGEQVMALIADRQPVDLQDVTHAQCEAVMGRPERAAIFFERALKRDPEDVYALLQAAAFYLAQKDTSKAKPLLERLQRLAPRLPEDRLAWVKEQLRRE